MFHKKPKKQRDLGICQFCGEPIREYSYGWACSNKECKTVIYRDDKFFYQVLKKPLSKSKAITLLTGGRVKVTNVNIHGVKHDMYIRLGYDRSGVYANRYTMNYLDKYDRKKDRNYANELDSSEQYGISAFDAINSDELSGDELIEALMDGASAIDILNEE